MAPGRLPADATTKEEADHYDVRFHSGNWTADSGRGSRGSAAQAPGRRCDDLTGEPHLNPGVVGVGQSPSEPKYIAGEGHSSYHSRVRSPGAIRSAAAVACLASLLLASSSLTPTYAQVLLQPRSSSLPIVANVGQFDPGVRFQLRAGLSTLWITDASLWITFLTTLTRTSRPPTTVSHSDATRIRGVAIKLTFPGSRTGTPL